MTTITTTGSATPIAVATRVYEAFDAGNPAIIDELVAADLVDHNPVPGAPTARDGLKGLVAAVATGFTNPRHEVLYQAETVDGFVVTQWRMTGTHTGDWFGTPATGRDVSFAGTDIVRVVDGRIVEIRHVEELLQLSMQLA